MAGRLQQLCRERFPSTELLTAGGAGRLQPNRLPGACPGLAQPGPPEQEADEGVICLADDNYFFVACCITPSISSGH